MSGFKKAQRVQAKIKLAITGPSGSGKTFSALTLAAGMGGRIALIDTENKSASLYSDRFDFDTQELSAPYSTEKYIAGIKMAIAEGYDILIIDSVSHAWAGEGGILQQKDAVDARGGNSFTNWSKVNPKHEAFLAAILHSQIHVIVTMRSKQDYILQETGTGKQAPKKVGLAPIQRDGMEYEFTTVFDVAMNHEALASKDRTGLFTDRTFKIDEDTGQLIMQWINGAALAPQSADQPKIPPPIQPKQASVIKPKASTDGPPPGWQDEDLDFNSFIPPRGE